MPDSAHPPELRRLPAREVIAAPTLRQVRHEAELRDLRREFEQRHASLLAEFEMQKSRINRKYWFGND